MRRGIVPFLAAVVVLAFAGAASAADNWIGSWKVNAAESKGSGGLRASTLTFEAVPEGIRLTADSTDAQGKPTKTSYVAKFDGSDAAWSGNAMADTASPKRVDDNSYTNTWKKGGKVTVTAKVTVSADGKKLTVSQQGMTPDGAKVDMTTVYDRQ